MRIVTLMRSITTPRSDPATTAHPAPLGALWAGVGTDILLVERIRSCLVDSPAFMHATFTRYELAEGNRRSDQSTYYAKVFAAKEAVFKCFGIAADELASWSDIEITASRAAQPAVRLHGSMARLARVRGIERILLSLSGDTEYVVAFAIAAGQNRRGS
jgi:holo-[acyl-carrier protein] synthase